MRRNNKEDRAFVASNEDSVLAEECALPFLSEIASGDCGGQKKRRERYEASRSWSCGCLMPFAKRLAKGCWQWRRVANARASRKHDYSKPGNMNSQFLFLAAERASTFEVLGKAVFKVPSSSF
ncbi:MAG: hypothetical protein LBJ38_02055 [Oscillospiraceae bacterium]|nr:hypothetical protein [Oscillospiraceae bacterium]